LKTSEGHFFKSSNVETLSEHNLLNSDRCRLLCCENSKSNWMAKVSAEMRF
jgi:hypothetical protein